MIKPLKIIWLHVAEDTLYRNSVLLMLNTGVSAGLGFVFWSIATHLYTSKDIGLTASLISIATVVYTFSSLGFDSSLIKYLPASKHVSMTINAAVNTTLLASVFITSIYLSIVKFSIPSLHFLLNSLVVLLIFVLFMLINTVNSLSNSVFVSYRKAEYIVFVSIFFSLSRLAFLPLFRQYGLYGLFLSHMFATCLGLLITYYFVKVRLIFKYKYRFVINNSEIKLARKYAFQSYLSTITLAIPPLLLPTILVHSSNANEAAYYYIVSLVIGVLYIIPSAVAQSLFAEGSRNAAALPKLIVKALSLSYIFLIPASLLLLIFGHQILHIFGSNYSHQGYTLLVILIIAGIPKVLNYALSTAFRIKGHLNTLIVAYSIYAIVMILGNLLGIKKFGINSIGYVSLFAESTATLILIITYFRTLKGVY